MIDFLRIENFKCWEDTGKVRLAPITVFFGSNSSGKSSIGQFLMMLKQSVESSDRKTVFFSGNEQSPVDVGLPSEMIYNKDGDRHIQFEYGWRNREAFDFADVISKKRFQTNAVHFKGDVKLRKGTQSMEVECFHYDLFGDNDDNKEVIDIELRKKKESKRTKNAYELISENYDFKRSMGRAWDITSAVRFYGFPDEAVAYYQNADFLQKVNLVHEKLFSTIYYLGPLRNRAKRLYTWPGIIPEGAGIYGENAINALVASREEKRLINLKNKSPRKTLEEIVASELKKMQLIEDFRVEKITNELQEYAVKVRTKGDTQYVDIPDVGVGVSQVLPVIVQLFYAPPGSTIIIEQPELHLHPNAQAALADVVIDAIHAKEEHKSREIQLIIESHSEHFLRRLQRRLAEDIISTEELQAYFVDMKKGSSHLEPLQIDMFGDITNWPKGFFGDINEDIYQQANAAYNKRIRLGI